ncbi:hypothetical protein JRQ81_007386, partial [Phrynocephalus forsythii]
RVSLARSLSPRHLVPKNLTCPFSRSLPSASSKVEAPQSPGSRPKPCRRPRHPLLRLRGAARRKTRRKARRRRRRRRRRRAGGAGSARPGASPPSPAEPVWAAEKEAAPVSNHLQQRPAGGVGAGFLQVALPGRVHQGGTGNAARPHGSPSASLVSKPKSQVEKTGEDRDFGDHAWHCFDIPLEYVRGHPTEPRASPGARLEDPASFHNGTAIRRAHFQSCHLDALWPQHSHLDLPFPESSFKPSAGKSGDVSVPQ